MLTKSGLNEISLVNDVNENYIHKDKIRNKIDELKKDMIKNGEIIDNLYDLLEEN